MWKVLKNVQIIVKGIVYLMEEYFSARGMPLGRWQGQKGHIIGDVNGEGGGEVDGEGLGVVDGEGIGEGIGEGLDECLDVVDVEGDSGKHMKHCEYTPSICSNSIPQKSHKFGAIMIP